MTYALFNAELTRPQLGERGANGIGEPGGIVPGSGAAAPIQRDRANARGGFAH
jgi:hypothetical protein